MVGTLLEQSSARLRRSSLSGEKISTAGDVHKESRDVR